MTRKGKECEIRMKEPRKKERKKERKKKEKRKKERKKENVIEKENYMCRQKKK